MTTALVVTVARKPLSEGSVAANVLKHGTGALNIKATRISFASEEDEAESKTKNRHADYGSDSGANQVYGDYSMIAPVNYNPVGRWPANLVLSHRPGCQSPMCVAGCPIAELDEQSGTSKSATGPQKYVRADTSGWVERGGSFTPGREWGAEGYGDVGGASRFFKTCGGSK